MKRRVFSLVFLLGIFASGSSHAEDDILSVGVGAGALYSGIGVNVGKRGEHSFRYLAAGCRVGCGVGAGWIWTDLRTKANDRQGLGVYVGPVSSRVTSGGDKVVYGAGLTYVHFFGDAIAKGWNLGITPTVGKKNGEYSAGLLINAGYQF